MFAEEQKLNLTRVTDVSAGICPLGPSKRVKAAIRRAAKDIDLPADQACRRLKAYFASRFGIAPDRMLFANSGSELLYRCCQALQPTAVITAGAARIPEIVPEDAAAPASVLPGLAPGQFGRGDLLVLSNPDRITGREADREALRAGIAAAAAVGALVVLDEALSEFPGDDSFMQETGALDNLIVLRTTANFYGLPGLELAYAVASPQLIARLQAVLPTNLNHLALAAAETALKDKTYIRTARDFIRKERHLLFLALRKISGMTVCASDSNVYLLRVEAGLESIVDRFSRAGFLVQDCSDLAGLGRNYLRLSVMSSDKNRKLVRLLKEAAEQPAT